MPDIDLNGATYPDVPAVDLPKSGGGLARFYDPSGIDYASSPTSGGNANRTNAILYGNVDSTSTATAFTATVAGLDQLVDGTCVMLHNGVVTSASGFTVNINGLGAKPCYSNMTNATRDTTIFNVAYTMLLVYSSSLNSGSGGWWIYRGYDANTNTIGYQLRTNSSTLPASDKFYRYRLLFTSADGTKWVPANTSSSTNATSSRTPNTKAIDPFGPIVYYGTTTAIEANANVSATQLWQQYTLSLGYSFNTTGAALTLTPNRPVYLKCTNNLSGAHMEGIVQSLPSSRDKRIYIYLGRAYSATNIELTAEHPVYWYDGEKILPWAGVDMGDYVRRDEFELMLDECSLFTMVAGDATAKAVLESMMSREINIISPDLVTTPAALAIMLNARFYLAWTYGTKIEMSQINYELDMTTQAVTLYARGLHSVASGLMGVDDSWTVTAL